MGEVVSEAEGLGQVTIDTKALRAALESEPGSVSVRLTKTLVDDLCDELEAAQAALENIHAMVGRRGSCIGAKAIVACVTDGILSMRESFGEARAIALEEAALKVEANLERNAYDEADSIRALADKPPGVVCVKREDLELARDMLVRPFAEPRRRAIDILDAVLK